MELEIGCYEIGGNVPCVVLFVRGSSGAIQELMILERTREMRRSFAKERAKADAVIQFLSQQEREDRNRRELVHMKRSFLLVRRGHALLGALY